AGAMAAPGLALGGRQVSEGLAMRRPATPSAAEGRPIPVLGGLFWLPPAVEAPPAAPAAPPADEGIHITGSAIERTESARPAPVTVIGREDLLASGRQTLGEILQNLPAQANATNTQVNNGGDGSVRFNLRG